MNGKLIVILGALFSLTACVSIPKETIEISKTLGNDLVIIQASHKNAVALQFRGMRDQINSFVDEVYAPFVIHFVLEEEIRARERGDRSIYTTIELAGTKGGQEETEAAMKDIQDFLVEANLNIENERTALLEPILLQEAEVMKTLDQSYYNMIYANSTLTAYLESIRKVKDAQNEALGRVGLSEAQEVLSSQLLEASQLISRAVKEGKKIDVKSEDALMKLNDISSQIKSITKNQ